MLIEFLGEINILKPLINIEQYHLDSVCKKKVMVFNSEPYSRANFHSPSHTHTHHASELLAGWMHDTVEL